MNCANHPNVERVAFCRTCGKALCAACSRNVRGVIYCENCLADRLGSLPVTPTAPGVVNNILAAPPPMGDGGPNPALAGILAGFFPFGVGAVYTGQYAKGLAHLIIFTGLVWGLSSGHDSFAPVLGIGMAFFYVYQIIDSVRSAWAVRLGSPVPDPLGLAQTFGAGEQVDTSKIPTAAIVLIGIGGLFLLQTMGLFELDFNRIWPFFMIGLAAWVFAQRWGFVGESRFRCYCDRCRMRGLMGPAVIATIGLLGLLDSFGRGWSRSWPILLIVIGVVKIMQGQASAEGHVAFGIPSNPVITPPAAPPQPPSPPASVPPPPSSEVPNG